MKITLPRKQLKEIATALSRITQKNTVPVLKCARFTLTNTALSITATNLEETLTYRTDPDTVTWAARDGEPGSFLCPVSELKGLAKDGGDNVTLVYADETLTAECNLGDQVIQRTLPFLPASEFPELPQTEADFHPADFSELLPKIQAALRSSSWDSTRYVLNSVFLNKDEQEIVGTDGRRLTAMPFGDLQLSESIIVPRTKTLESSLFAKTKTGEIGVFYEEAPVNARNAVPKGRLELRSECWHYSVKSVEGCYPPYRLAVPQFSALVPQIRFAPEDLPLAQSAIRRLTDRKDQPIVLYADPTRVCLLALTQEGKCGSHIRLPNSTCTGNEPVYCAVNRDFLLDAFRSGFSTLRFETDTKPVLFENDSGSIYVIMPMINTIQDDVAAYVERTLAKKTD
jgi:DNA polymerase III sliding clamp (beta) subunit (PCNA family)